MMLEELYRRESYPNGMALKIEILGSIAVSVANRWMLGWPERVEALIQSGTYLDCLETQVNLEKDILAEVVEMQHLSNWEILRLHEVKESPPMM